jgi:cytidine deaminase
VAQRANKNRSLRKGSKKAVLKGIAALRPRPYPELVIGLIGPVGTNLDAVIAGLRSEFVAVGYKNVENIRLSRLIEQLLGKNYSSLPEERRIAKLMDGGTDIRERTKLGHAVALLAVSAIRRARREKFGGETQGNAYILRSLKHPQEIAMLRNIYGRGFYAISVYSPRDVRVESLTARIAKSRPTRKIEGARAEAERLIERDELEELTSLGQDVRDAFPLADFFVDGRDKAHFEPHLKRFVELVFSHPFHTPTRDEYGMYHAKATALRSADLGRQVGAAIASSDGDIVAVGCNEVPKAGGGLYWYGDSPDGRDYLRPIDSTTEQREQIIGELLSRLRDLGWLASKQRARRVEALVNELVYGRGRAQFKGTQVFSLLEFGRTVHAEMAALMDAARRGVSVKGGTLFSTTFPCHLCARHIIAAGLTRVVYIEPYPKSKARELFPDSMAVDPVEKSSDRVNFEPFVGVAPRQYLDLFEPLGDRKDAGGRPIEWRKSGPKPRFQRFLNTYIELETLIVGDVLPAIARNVRKNLRI